MRKAQVTNTSGGLHVGFRPQASRASAPMGKTKHCPVEEFDIGAK